MSIVAIARGLFVLILEKFLMWRDNDTGPIWELLACLFEIPIINEVEKIRVKGEKKMKKEEEERCGREKIGGREAWRTKSIVTWRCFEIWEWKYIKGENKEKVNKGVLGCLCSKKWKEERKVGKHRIKNNKIN